MNSSLKASLKHSLELPPCVGARDKKRETGTLHLFGKKKKRQGGAEVCVVVCVCAGTHNTNSHGKHCALIRAFFFETFMIFAIQQCPYMFLFPCTHTLYLFICGH
jgi:hypothetical protein